MTGDDWANLTYLLVLLVGVGGYALLQARRNLNQSLQYAALWGLIFLGAIAAVGLWEDVRGRVAPFQMVSADAGEVRIPRAPDGHYYLTLAINGAPIRFLVDTGATSIVITTEDAAAAGIDVTDLIFMSEAMTANGPVRTAPVRLDLVTLGKIEDRGVLAFVNEGQMPESLLGMEYIQRFAGLEIRGREMILRR